MKKFNLHLYLVTDEASKCRYSLLETVRKAADGGYKKGCSDFRRNSLLPVIRQKSRYIRAQQQAGQSSAQKSAQQQRRHKANFVLQKAAAALRMFIVIPLPLRRLF